jgi:hypothetical protein
MVDRENLQKIAPMASTKIAFYIYYLLIISPGIHVCVLHGFCKITLRKLFKKSFLGRSHMGTLGTKTSQVVSRARALLAIP